jgi:hypothetical protein
VPGPPGIPKIENSGFAAAADLWLRFNRPILGFGNLDIGTELF